MRVSRRGKRARDPEATAAPEVSLAGVTRTGGLAHVALELGPDAKPIAFEMEQQPDRSWRIVSADPRQLTALVP